jgi:hypothetical protein
MRNRHQSSIEKIAIVKSKNQSSWMRDELFHLLSISASLSGLCITVVALMKNFGKIDLSATIVDDMFAICSVLFLICVYLIFFALRDKTPALVLPLFKFIDLIFLIAMTSMTMAALVMVYTVW